MQNLCSHAWCRTKDSDKFFSMMKILQPLKAKPMRPIDAHKVAQTVFSYATGETRGKVKPLITHRLAHTSALRALNGRHVFTKGTFT